MAVQLNLICVWALEWIKKEVAGVVIAAVGGKMCHLEQWAVLIHIKRLWAEVTFKEIRLECCWQLQLSLETNKSISSTENLFLLSAVLSNWMTASHWQKAPKNLLTLTWSWVNSETELSCSSNSWCLQMLTRIHVFSNLLFNASETNVGHWIRANHMVALVDSTSVSVDK